MQRSDLPPDDYHAMRERLGSTYAVAQALGVARQTLIHREAGVSPIHVESELAMRWLVRRGARALPAPPKRARPPKWGTCGELREALAILGVTQKEIATEIWGPDSESMRSVLSRMCVGLRPVSERVARTVKRRLGLVMEDPWPKRDIEAVRAADVRAIIMGGGR